MPYVRRKGNQLAIVHGERDPATKAVQQRTLFTLYSKAEALAATGEKHDWFRRIVQEEHPDLRFNWKSLDAAIQADIDHLPDAAPASPEHIDGRFRAGLVAFTRELLLADPQELLTSARLIEGNRHALEYVRGLIDWRLRNCKQTENEWNQDTPFFWRSAMHRRECPGEAIEALGELYNRNEYGKVKALARLLVDCWDNFADGHSYLGLVALDAGDIDAAIGHFETAIKVGRTLFPKRIRKSDYWSLHETRPFIRALCHLAEAQTRNGQYEGALALCDRLDHECGQDITAANERIAPYLNGGQWTLAAAAARYVHLIYPEENIPLAFALFELGDRRMAVVHFLHAALKSPNAAKLLCGVRSPAPADSDSVRSHNRGVSMPRDLAAYLGAHAATRKFFARLLARRDVAELLTEMADVRKKWHENRSVDRTWFDRMTTMESIEFAAERAAALIDA